MKIKRPKFNVKDAKREAQIQGAVREVFKEFCTNSTIHGVQYFADRKRHWTERCWWIVVFSLSVFFCGSSIHDIWTQWRVNPVTLSFTEKNEPISTIPFPTITICPETKAILDELDVTAAYYATLENNLTDAQLFRMKALVQVCKFKIFDGSELNERFANESLFSVIAQMAPKLDETLMFCLFQYETRPCSAWFVETFTEDGLCYAFNAQNSHEIYTNEMAPEIMIINNNPNMTNWTFENGYDDKANENTYPIRVFNARNSAGLIITLRLWERDLEYLCGDTVQGFKLILSTPGQIPKISRHVFRVPLSEQGQILITPKLITTSDDLLHYKPSQRKCFFSYERHLRFFRIYTQNNCEAECLANFTKIECDCVKFSMTRDVNTRICGASQIKCYENAEKKLFGEDIIDGLKDSDARGFRENCNCFPTCTSIVYDAEIDRAKFDWMATLRSYKIPFESFPKMQASSIAIFFRDHEVETLRRSARYTYTDFLAVCGGLLGLFLGVSTLSIIEFIYYATLRLYWTFQQRKEKTAVVPLKRKHIKVIPPHPLY